MSVFGIMAVYTGSNVFREMTTYYVNDNFWDNGRLHLIICTAHLEGNAMRRPKRS